MNAPSNALLATEQPARSFFIPPSLPGAEPIPARRFSEIIADFAAPDVRRQRPVVFRVSPVNREQAQTVIQKARKQSLFGDGTSQSWMEDPSHQALELFAAEQIGDKERDFGHISELTHSYEAANAGVNWDIPALKNYPSDVIAYIYFSHDFLETLRRKKSITSQRIVNATWLGDPQVKPFLRHSLNFFTDNPNERGVFRFFTQIDKAIKSDEPLLINGRAIDKFVTYIRDLWNIKTDRMTFAGKQDAADYIENKLLPREWMVRHLPVDKHLKQEFVDMRREIVSSIAEQLERRRWRSGGAAIRLATDYVPDSPKEPETRIRQLIRLGGEAPAV